MTWKPDRMLSSNLVSQITSWITEQIEEGHWPVGTKLPPQRKLALLLEVNRSTIQEALDELKALGILASKKGAGTYVANNSWNLLNAKQPNWQRFIDASIHKPNYQTIQLINEFEQDATVIRLSTGELAPELLPSEAITASMQQITLDGQTLGYSSPQGSLRLRQALCHYLKKRGIDADPDQICIVSGGLQALNLIAIGLFESGSIIFQDEFSYLHSIHPFQSFGMHLRNTPQQLWTSTLLKQQLGNRQGAFYAMPTLHNPTGACWDESQLQSFYTLCHGLQLPIIEDDVYFELAFDAAIPPLKAADPFGQVLYLGSVSKTLSPGLRIGWIVAPKPVIARLADIKMQLDYGSSAISQEIVTYWLTTGLYEKHVEQLRMTLKERARLMEHLLIKYFKDIATWQAPLGGFYIWLKFNKTIVTIAFFSKLLKQKILIHPGYIYAAKDANHVRLSFAYATPKELQHGLNILAAEAKQALQLYK